MSSHRRGFTPRPVHVAPSRDFAFPSVLSSAREQIVVDRSGGRSDEWSCKENEMNYTIEEVFEVRRIVAAPIFNNFVPHQHRLGLFPVVGPREPEQAAEVGGAVHHPAALDRRALKMFLKRVGEELRRLPLLIA